jgi:hypothetical protein
MATDKPKKAGKRVCNRPAATPSPGRVIPVSRTRRPVGGRVSDGIGSADR